MNRSTPGVQHIYESSIALFVAPKSIKSSLRASTRVSACGAYSRPPCASVIAGICVCVARPAVCSGLWCSSGLQPRAATMFDKPVDATAAFPRVAGTRSVRGQGTAVLPPRTGDAGGARTNYPRPRVGAAPFEDGEASDDELDLGDMEDVPLPVYASDGRVRPPRLRPQQPEGTTDHGSV